MSDLPTSRGGYYVPACRHTEGPHHSCEAVERRNRLIPRAMLEAQRVCAATAGSDQDVTREFMRAMNRLAGTPSPKVPPREEPAVIHIRTVGLA